MKNKMKTPDDSWHEIEKELISLDVATRDPMQPTALAGILQRMLRVQCDVAKTNDKTTQRVVRLTWGLLVLTVILGLVALVQTAIMIWGQK